MAKLNNTDGFILHGWMVNELGLRGGALFAFALIHQFSQSNAGVYKGGVPYLAAWLGCCGNTARTYLHDLEEQGLVLAERGTSNGIPFCYYRVSPDTLQKLQGTLQNLEDYPSKIEVPTPQKLEGGTPQNLEVENNNKKIKKDNNREHSPAFSKPTIEEVRAYCLSRNNGIDPEEFWAFYESKGWKIGKSPMKDWRMAVVTWEKKRQKTPVTIPHPRQPLGDYYSGLLDVMQDYYGTKPSTPGLDID